MSFSLKFYASFLILFFCFACGPAKGKLFQSFSKEISAENIVLISAYYETGFLISGAIYEFEVKNKEKGKTKHIFTFRHDDPIEIPIENIVVKDEKLTYFWIGWKFAVTTDGGEKWGIWDASAQEGFNINYRLIENVEIQPDGTGKMIFNDLARKRKGIAMLLTKDFGKTWEKN